LGSRLVQELGSFVERFKNLMTHISTPKSMEKVVAEVMHVDKATKFFQTMEVVNLIWGI
jgi:hypothetical protein